MNTSAWFAGLDALGFITMHTLLSVFWQSSIVLGCIGILTYVLRNKKDSVRYTLWVTAILLLPLLPLLTWGVSKLGAPQKEITVIPAYTAFQTKVDQNTLESLMMSEQSLFETDAMIDLSPQNTVDSHVRENRSEKSDTRNNLNISSSDDLLKSQERNSEINRLSLLSYPWAFAFMVYTSCVLILLLWILTARLRIRKWILSSEAVMDQRIIEIFQSAKEHLGISRNIIIIENKHALSPMTCRTFSPVIVLPDGFVKKATETELRAVAAHELSHVKRNDMLILTFITLVKAVFFLHPLVWLAAREISFLAESLSDNEALNIDGNPVFYASMLSRVARNLPENALNPELAMGIVLSKSMFLRRIEAILSEHRKYISKLSRWALLGTATAAVLSLIIALSLPLGYAGEIGDMVTIYGKVLYKGKPVSGAEIYFNEIKRKHIEKVAKTDKNGVYTFKMSETRLAYGEWTKPTVIAYRPGYAFGYKQLSSSIPLENFIITLSDPISFKGKVTDTSGNVVKDAEVSFNMFGTYTVRKAKIYFRENLFPPLNNRTDNTGTFVFNDLPDTHYGFFSVIKEGYAAGRKLIMDMRGNEEVLILKSEGRIKGRITYNDTGKPAKNLMVGAEQEWQRYMELRATTDTNGYYEFTNVPAGNFTLYLIYDEEFPEWTMMKKENIIVKEGKTVQGVDLTLIKGGIITGKIVDKDTGKPIPKHVIGFTDKRRISRYSNHYVHTDSYGVFKYRTTPGRHKFHTSNPEGYLQQEGWKELIFPGDHRLFVEAEAVSGQTVTVSDLAFKKGLAIHGKVQNPQGEPVSGVTISYGYALNEVEAMSDKNGTYTFFGLKPGEKLSLRAIHADLKLRGKIEVEISLDAKAVSFLEKDKNEIQPYINTDIQLEPYETTRIEGRLVDEKGNPIPSGRINIFPFYKPDDRNLPLPSTVFSDETGSYSFDDLIVGDKYRVIVVDAKGYVSNKNSNYEDMFIAEKNMEPHKDLVLSLQGDIWLEGKVVDSEGNPVVGAKLSSWNDNNSAVTDTYGKYRLGNLSNILIYSLTIVQKDFGIYQFKYIPANQIKNFTLAKGKYFIAGTVVDSEGNSVDSVLVNVYPRLHISGKHSPSVYTASDGTFLLENLYDELITINVGTRKGSQIFENVRTGRDDMLLVLDNLTQRNSAYARFFDEFNKIIKDKPAPELEIDQWVNCEPMILDDLLGRIVLVDFFFDRFKNDQTPNRTQLIQVLQEEYGAEGLVCIGICEHTEDFETLKELIREKNLTYPIAVDKESTRLGSSGLTFDAYRINPQAPLSIVIDKNGIVRSQTSHMFLESTIKELIKEGN